jgi:uncharacterized membrane protein YdcZ (DUF606 family)
MVWMAALCLSLRTVFDSALASYYPWPPMALALVVAATRGRTRVTLTALCALGVTVTASWHFGPWWAWWLGVVGGLALTLAAARPANVTLTRDTEMRRLLTAHSPIVRFEDAPSSRQSDERVESSWAP